MINKPPNTLIIGPGALGLGLAALFSAEKPASIMGPTQKSPLHKFIFAQAGSELLTESKDLEVPVTWIEPTSKDLSQFDYIWITTPAYRVEEALEKLRDSKISAKLILIASNGLGHFEKAKEILGSRAAVCRALVEVGFKIEPESPSLNRVIITGRPKVTLAGDQELSEEMDSLCKQLKNENWLADVSFNPLEAEWKKVIFNIFVNPICALLGCPNGEVLKSALPVALAAAEEAKLVAQRVGIDVSSLTKESLIHKVSFSSSNICSTLAQLRQNKKTELDYITGKVIEIGKTVGISTPVVAALHSLVKAREDLSKI
jgi:2-dehydropantoate 2-reductase